MESNKQEKVFVTKPSLPDLKEYTEYLEDIWETGWLTNNGKYHKLLEERLKEKLGVSHISLFANGTLALISALQVLRISGEVITTPYSFVATTHALHWNNIKPVFVDIDPATGNIDPNKIEAAITPKTTAILPVHVYGNPADVDRIQNIADTYGLKVIYDAAHAFGVEKDGHSVLNFGDLSVLSFHATKTYNTIEGGAIICPDEKTKMRIDYLKNFGFADETTVVAPGINAKMNELQAAFGLLQLKDIEGQICRRKAISELYTELLRGVSGIELFRYDVNVKYNYSYFPVFIKSDYPLTRDELYEKLKSNNIYGRRYFYPLISDFSTYKGLNSASHDNLPKARQVSEEIICLPLYADLHEDTVRRIVNIMKDVR